MFSIIIPTFNNLDYLKLCLKSLKKNEEKVARVTVGINTNKAKVSINLVEIFAPTVPFFLSIHV